MSDKILNQLLEAQNKCYKAHTEQIIELASGYINRDDVIKQLIDERRTVYQEFNKRIKLLSQ